MKDSDALFLLQFILLGVPALAIAIVLYAIARAHRLWKAVTRIQP